MNFAGIRAMLPIAALALGLAASGCDKAKKALEEAAGVSQLTGEEKSALLKEVGWDEAAPQFADFKVHGGFTLTEKFSQDLGKADTHVPIPFDVPAQGQQTAGNQRSIALVRKESFNVDAATTYTRLRIITVARYDAAAKELIVDGAVINKYIPANKQVNLANKNQAGTYLLIEGKGDKGLAFLTGTVKLIKDGKAEADAEPVADALVFTSSSPFVTISGDKASEGKYFLSMLAGSKGSTFAFKSDIGTVALGTPTTATKEIAYSGVLSQYQADVDAKVGKLGNADASSKSTELFNKANTAVTDFVQGWTLVVTDLRFKQPPQAKPPVPTPNPAAPPAPAPKPGGTPVETKPAPDTPVLRRDPAADPIYNVDLGCAGEDDAGAAIEIVRDGTKFDDYSAAKGWRGTGDVRIAYDLATEIFGDPAEIASASGGRYLDGIEGYCLLSTGNSLYNLDSTHNSSYLPGPDGAGQISEMFQKVNVPATAASIQVRVAFFSQEFPQFVGTSYNDSFFVKFDESPDMIAQGNLNDLAGINDPAMKDAVDGCKAYDGSDNTKTCGEWMFTKSKDGLPHGELWDVGSSTQGPATGDKFNCLNADAKEKGTRCYHGMIKPRIICKDLTAQDQGKLRTLRFNVSDAGDAYYDSALAVDSVVFSTKACAEPTGRTTPDPDSQARKL